MFFRNLIYALRGLRQHPLRTAAIVLTFELALGVDSAIGARIPGPGSEPALREARRVTAAAFLATYIPARRIVMQDPAIALRHV